MASLADCYRIITSSKREYDANPCASLTQSSEAILMIPLFQGGNPQISYCVLPTSKTYLNNEYVEEDISFLTHTSNSTFYKVIQGRPSIPTILIFSFRKNSNNECYIHKIVRSNEPVKPSIQYQLNDTSKPRRLYFLLSPSEWTNTSNGYYNFNASNQSIIISFTQTSDLNTIGMYYMYGSLMLLDTLLDDSDWDEPRLYKLIMSGPPSSKAYSVSPDGYQNNAMIMTYDSLDLNYYNLVDQRMNNPSKYGFVLELNKPFRADKSCNVNEYLMFVVYFYDFGTIPDVGTGATFSLKSSFLGGRMTVDSVFVIYTDSGNFKVDISLTAKVGGTGVGSTLQATYTLMPTSNPMNATLMLGNGYTITKYPVGNDVTHEVDFYTTITVLNKISEPLPYSGINRAFKLLKLEALVGSGFNSTHLGPYRDLRIALCTLELTQNGGFDIRLRNIATIDSLVDYSLYDPSYADSSYETGLTGMTYIKSSSSVLHTPKHLSMSNIEYDYTYDCSRRFGYQDRNCEYCKEGYGTDLTNVLQRPNNYICTEKSNCTTLDYYYWYDAGLDAINPNHTKALCGACPFNCKKCSWFQNCTECSPFSVIALAKDMYGAQIKNPDGSNRYTCKCQVSDCKVCVNETCNLCEAFNSSSTPHLHRIVNTTNTNCSLQNICQKYYGLNLDYKYDPYYYYSYDYKVCDYCKVDKCEDCSSNYKMCFKCEPDYSLLDRGNCLPPVYYVYECARTDQNLSFAGVFHNAASFRYEKCLINLCIKCDIERTNHCQICSTGYIFTPSSSSCILKTACKSKTSGLYPISNLPDSESCEKCLDFCGYCLNNTYCYQCKVGYVYNETNNTCVTTASCFNNTYHQTTMIKDDLVSNDSYPVCLKCMPNCQHCTPTTPCVQCSPGFFYHAPLNQCLNFTECTVTHKSYTTLSNGYIPLCIPCLRNCTSCQNGTHCDVCNQSVEVPGDELLFHLDLNHCVEPSFCTVGTNASYRLSDIPRYCKSCKKNCKNCSTSTDCWECKSNFFVEIDNSTCVSTCSPQSTWLNQTHCTPCPPNCLGCERNNGTNFTDCTLCLPNFYFNDSRNCTDCQNFGFFVMQGLCKECLALDCLMCENKQTECKECVDLMFVNQSKECEICREPKTYTPDKLCVECLVKDCKKCRMNDATRCEMCQRGFSLQAGQCTPQTFRVDNSKYSKSINKVALRFEHNVDERVGEKYIQVFHRDSSKEKLSDWVQLNISSVKVSEIDHRDISIVFKGPLQFDHYDLKIVFTNLTNISSTDRVDYFLSEEFKVIDFVGNTFYNPEMKTTEISGIIISGVMIGGLGIATLFSITFAMVLIKIYQLMDFMLLYNVDYPSNFDRFIEMFKNVFPLNLIPDVFESLYDDTCSELGVKFVQQDMGCQFLSNSGTSLSIFLCFILIKLIIHLVCYFSRKSSSKCAVRLRTWRDGAFGFKGYFYYFATFDIDIHLGAFTNSKFYAGDKIKTFNNIGNMLIANTWVYGYPLIVLYFGLKNRQMVLFDQGKHDLDETEEKSYSFFIEGSKLNNRYSKFWESFQLLKNYAICMLVVGFYERPRVQIISVGLVLLGVFILEIIYRPKTSKLENAINALVWIHYSVLTALFVSIDYLDDQISAEKIYTFVGFPMIFIFSSLVVVNLAPAFYQIYSDCKQCIKKRREQKNEKKNGGEKKEVKKNMDDSMSR